MAVAFALARAGQRLVNAPRWRQVALAGVAILMFGVAEAKFVWYWYHYRNPDRSDQAVVLEHQARLAGRVLFRDRQDAGGLFVARWLVGTDARYAADLDMFLSNSRVDDFFVTSASVSHADVELIGSSGGYSLFRRCDSRGRRPPIQDHARQADAAATSSRLRCLLRCGMAGQPSFDVTSTVDVQEVDNAVNQAKKEIAQRYDFKGSKSSIDFKRAENVIDLVADDTFKMEAVWDILQTRLVRRGVPIKNLKPTDPEPIRAGSSAARSRCSRASRRTPRGTS